MTEVGQSMFYRATCIYNVDSDTLRRQSTLAVKVVRISTSAYLSYIWLEGFALK